MDFQGALLLQRPKSSKASVLYKGTMTLASIALLFLPYFTMVSTWTWSYSSSILT